MLWFLLVATVASLPAEESVSRSYLTCSCFNATVRLLTGTKKRHHMSPVLTSLHWLSLNCWIDFKIIYMFLKLCVDRHQVISLNSSSSTPPPPAWDLLTTFHALSYYAGLIWRFPLLNSLTLTTRPFIVFNIVPSLLVSTLNMIGGTT